MIFIIFSMSLSASGEISFRKQKERVLREQQEQQADNKKTEDTSRKKTGTSAVTNKERSVRRAVLDTAFSQMGVKYIYGANGNGAYDCSSYVQYVYKKSLNINLPRVSYQQAEAG